MITRKLISILLFAMGLLSCSDKNPVSSLSSSSNESSPAILSSSQYGSSGASSALLNSSSAKLSSGTSSGIFSSSSISLNSSAALSSKGSSSSVAASSSSSSYVGPPANAWCATAGHCSYIVDPRDGESYQTTKIAGMTWLAENLRYAAPTGYTSGYYAGLYNFKAAQTACPGGWHLPSVIEWTLLVDSVGMSSAELKKDSLWWASSSYKRLDAFGFHALPEYNQTPGFGKSIFGISVEYWQYPQRDNSYGDYLEIRYDNDHLYTQHGDTAVGYAQRCVQDPETKIPPSTWCNTAGNCGTFTDARDGQTYGWTKINGLTWMSQNLNYSGDNGSGGRAFNKGWCYGVSPADTTDHSESRMCNIAGRLYNYADAQTVCPAGWHLSDTTDLKNLKSFTIGGKLSGLISSSYGVPVTNDYGFSAIPGGERGPTGGYGDGGENSYFWVASAVSNGDATGWHFAYNTYYDFYYDVLSGYSVRCVKTQ